MAGYIGSKAVNLSTTGADIAGDADVSGALDVGGGLTVDNDGATVLTVNRATSDGSIVDFKKDGTTTVGSIGVADGDNLVISSTATDHGGLKFNNTAMAAYVNGASSDGTMSIGSSVVRFKDLYLAGDIAHKDAAGNARLLYDKSENLLGNAGTYLYGYGVYLGGVGAANLLDDYEEGTWTVSVSSGGANVSHASYTKIGRIVHIHMEIALTGTRGSESFRISGLPFTNFFWSAQPCYIAGYTAEGTQQLSAAVVGSQAQIAFIEFGNEAIGTDFTNGYMNVTATYRIA